jgi:hypothetical protein
MSTLETAHTAMTAVKSGITQYLVKILVSKYDYNWSVILEIS